ncbi:hypothetical protein GGR55DRAFT_672690 [Xylaria sp. FL0064]|nr:hypothetical protein GGR55DRAFT_672690 [Xylaria sp. FL0064]
MWGHRRVTYNIVTALAVYFIFVAINGHHGRELCSYYTNQIPEWDKVRWPGSWVIVCFDLLFASAHRRTTPSRVVVITPHLRRYA